MLPEKRTTPYIGRQVINKEVPQNEKQYPSEGHAGLYRVQAEELRYQEEQEEHSGASGAEQVLPLLQKAHLTQRDQVRHRKGEVLHVRAGKQEPGNGEG